jgi:hypothetical protein
MRAASLALFTRLFPSVEGASDKSLASLEQAAHAHIQVRICRLPFRCIQVPVKVLRLRMRTLR